MSHVIRTAIALALVLKCSALALADDEAKGVTLDVKNEAVKRIEVSHTQIGFSSTRIFYVLGGQSAVVVIHIDNADKKFPVGGKVHLFAKGITADDLSKWVNNQHSDGLFPDVPEPVATHQLKADSIKTTSSKRVGQEKDGFAGDIYDKYSVEVEAGTIDVQKNLKLQGFKDSATVYMKAPAKE